MAVELGSAFISVGLGTNSLAGDIKKAFGGAESAGKSAGSAAGNGFVASFKGLVGAGAALLGAGMFTNFVKEAAVASDATDKFKATMNFAGLDTSAIDAATASAKEFADQTVYDLPTIQNTIAQLASNGIKDYTGLTKAAGNLNAVAGGNAETFKSVSMVMTQTAGAGKLTTENWNQMADAIPGAAGPLMKALEEAGAYTGNFRDAMAAGQITSDEFNEALMKLGTDPIAVEAAKSTKTFEGAIGNLEATINSGLMGALDAMKPAITGAINLLSNGLGKAFEWTGKAATGLFDLFAKGDFTGALRDAFHVEEDSGLVGFLFNVRDAAIQLWSGLSMGQDVREQFGAQLTGIVKFGAGARAVFDETVGGFRAFVAAFKAGDGDITSAGFPGFMEQMGNVVRQVFDAIGPAIATLLPQVISLWQAFSPLSMIFQAIQPMLPTLVGTFGTLASTIGGALSGALTALVPTLLQLSAAFMNVFTSVLSSVLPVVIQLVMMLADTFTQLMPVLVPIITTIVQLATSLISQLAPIITNLISSILPPLVNIFGNIFAAITPLIQLIAGLLIPIIQALMPVVVTVFGVIADVITSAMQIVQGIIQVVTGVISGNWSQVWAGIQNIFAGIWNTIGSIIRGAINIVGSVISNGLNLVFNVVGNVLGSIGRFFSDTWNNITSGVRGFIDGFLRFFLDLPNRIMGALSGAGTWLLSVGRNIIDGLINGIQGMAGTVARAILNLVPEAIRGPIEAALGIHSPSRVAMWWMEMIGAGFIKQMPAEERRISAGMQNLVAAPALPLGSAGDGAAPALIPSQQALGFPSRLALMVGGREFEGYLVDTAAGVVATADAGSTYLRKGRQ